MANLYQLWNKARKSQLMLPITALILMLIINAIITPGFFKISINNGVLYGFLIDILNRSSELIILAVGMTFVAASSRGTDISVGTIAAVSAALIVRLLGSSYDGYMMNPALAIFFGLLLGLACGAVNGFLVAGLNIQPMVATLIMYTAGRGIAQLISSTELATGVILYVRMESYKYIGGFIPGCIIPTPIFIAVAFVAITYLVTTKTAMSTYIQTVGINPKAGRLVGINSVMVIFFCYVFSGLCSGVTGLIASSRIYSCDANNIGLNMELDAILAVALGGNSLGGGKFNLAGSVIGAITIQALTTSLYAVGVSADQLPVYKAVVVVLIVVFQSPAFKKWMAQRKLKTANNSLGTVTAK
ncbi:Ribose/xylose/arabinose/galactoside ABC-type transport system, permease component [Treponema sp. JC4]|uniref:ABC transporter permease n=1 Tax=Treponema sp. JC4 TaxID=1124982 RepID=UPI00025B0DAC|nr:ABC transporter permease [Treponema sp. JC4]EID85596.1 Ribose/xylose/arabinose/galactoside ABC-type transport system, permease component [Treponema sp. JC4]